MFFAIIKNSTDTMGYANCLYPAVSVFFLGGQNGS